MKRHVIIVCLICLASTFNSCSTKQESKANECYLEEENQLLLPTDIFSAVTFLPLETNDDFIIGAIGKALKIDNFYYFLDSQTKSIFVYDEAGKPVNKICNIGNGPNEYLRIEDFIVDINHIVLLCFPNKLMFFDRKTLTLKSEFKINKDVYYTKMAGWNDNILLCNYNTGQIDSYHDGQIKNIFKWDILKGYIPSPTPAFHVCNNKLYFHASGDDVIYQIDDDLQFSPLLTFDYKKKESAINFYSTREIGSLTNLMHISEYPLVDVQNMFYNKNGLVFIYSFEVIRVSYINDNGMREFKVLNVPVRQTIATDNQLITWTYPFMINELHGIHLKNNLANFTEHDNPILLIYDLK